MASRRTETDTFALALLAWYGRHGRDHLPWREEVTPYRVWVSEIMLQQTQVQTVIPYFERFLERFLDVAALAAADEDEVLHLWAGLGYYARARNLHRAAREVVANHGGALPADLEQLTALPGIGRSTAGAIVAIAFGGRGVILDGNVRRVLTRYHGVEGDASKSAVQKRLWSYAEQHTPADRADTYAQAIMDLGSLVCRRSKPDCPTCPVADGCVARATDRVDALPTRRTRQKLPVRATGLLVIEDAAGRLLLERRPPSGVWGGLWCFPEADDDPVPVLERLGIRETELGASTWLATYRHTFTHYHLDITPIHVQLRETPAMVQDPARWCWYHPDSNQPIGLASPVARWYERGPEGHEAPTDGLKAAETSL